MEDKEIRVHTDKRGKDHIDIYNGNPRGDHSSIHIKIDTNTGKGSIVDTTNGSRETTDTKCYLTSACMRHFQDEFDDNCYELFILRWFRDKFVPKRDIDHYYAVAPTIVENIDKMEDNEAVYNYIYNVIVEPCVKAIKMGDFEFVYNRYKSSVLILEEEFVAKEIKKSHVKSLGTMPKPSIA